MTKRKEVYERVGEKAERGEYSLIDPLDYKILGFLPKEGEIFAGLWPLGETTSNLSTKLGNVITSQGVSNRLRIMKIQGLVIQVRGGGDAPSNTRSRVWQRTERGTNVLKQWEKGSNGKGTNGVSSNS